MPGTRLRRGLTAAAVTAALTLAPALAAEARPLPDSGSASPVAGLDARTPTHLHGWKASARSVVAGHRLTARVTVSGGDRAVRLERRTAGEWRLLDRERTSAGKATLHWRARTAQQHVLLRVRVPATSAHAAVRSVAHRVRVVQPTAAAPSPTGTPSASATPTPSATPTASADEVVRARLLVLVNEARATARTCGSTAYAAAPALGRSSALDTAAGDYAVKMATEDFFAHESPDGSTMVTRLNAVGIRSTTMRENIAAGYGTAEEVMAGWLSSPGHCANLMAADVTRIGFGRATSTTARYGTYWVQDFAG